MSTLYLGRVQCDLCGAEWSSHRAHTNKLYWATDKKRYELGIWTEMSRHLAYASGDLWRPEFNQAEQAKLAHLDTDIHICSNRHYCRQRQAFNAMSAATPPPVCAHATSHPNR